jgi:hypothetical protein
MTRGMLARTSRAQPNGHVTAPRYPALRIAPPSDADEQQADRVADEAMTNDRAMRHWSLSTVHTAAPGFAPPIVHDALRSPGRSLHQSESRFFERTFGSNLDDVRIHADSHAAKSADAVGARAFTVGRHIVFNAGEYAPGSAAARPLLAHELTHVTRHHGPPMLRRQPKPEASSTTIRPLVQKFIRGEATEQERQALRDLLVTDQLNPAEVDALKSYLGRLIANQVVAQAQGNKPGQININIGGPTQNVHTFFKARLKLNVSGALRAVAGGLEGTLETLAEVTADKDKKKVTLRIEPPQGSTMLAEQVRARAFPNGELTLELGETWVKVFSMVSLAGDLTITITGKKASNAGGLVISSPKIPAGVELEATLSQSAEKPELAQATGAPALPPVRAFATGGVVSDPKQTGAATTVGLDVPLGTDTKDPQYFLGVGLRAGADTRGGAHLGGAVAVGANLNPVVLQLAFDAGIARFPASQLASGNSARGAGYFGVEGSVGVHVTKRVDIMALASLVGGLDRDVGVAGSLQVGAGVSF